MSIARSRGTCTLRTRPQMDYRVHVRTVDLPHKLQLSYQIHLVHLVDAKFYLLEELQVMNSHLD